MKLIKPMKLGGNAKAFEQPPKSYFAVSLHAFFAFEDPRKLLPEMAMMALTGEQIAEIQPFDFGMPKPTGEVLVYGKAYAPKGSTVPSHDVGVAVGEVSKRLRVFGDRVWLRDAVTDRSDMTPPVPFAEMELSYANAYGSKAYPRNPLGKGYGAEAELKTGATPALPNVEDPGLPVRSASDVREPASFGALDLAWPQRVDKMGTYDKAWMETTFPGYAKDADWSFLNGAPEDQWIDGMFEPGEEFQLIGMHPTQQQQRGRLPSLRPRALIRQKTDQGPVLREVELGADTLWLFPNVSKGILGWHGAIEIADSDGLDVEVLLLAAESLADQPRPIEHYSEIIERRLDPDKAARFVLQDPQLLPEPTAEEIAAKQARIEKLKKEQKEQRERQKAMGMQMALAAMGDAAVNPDGTPLELPEPESDPEIEALLDEMPVFAEEDIENFDIDVAAMMATSEKIQKVAEKKTEEAKAQADELMAEYKAEQEAKKAAETDADREARIAEQKMDVDAKVFDPLESQSLLPVDMSEMMENMPGEEDDPERQERIAQLQDAQGKAEDAMRDGRLQSPEVVPDLSEQEPETRQYLGEQILKAIGDGHDLGGRDLAGAALPGADLAGKNLNGVLLEKADLQGADLSGAALEKAVLTAAAIGGLNLSDANLASANLARCEGEGLKAPRAKLEETNVFESKLPKADFSGSSISKWLGINVEMPGARFDDAKLEGVNFIEADLTGASFRNAHIERCVFVKCKLAGADFTGAYFHRSIMVDAKGEDMILDDATINSFGVMGKDNDLRRLKARRIRSEKSCWRGANLQGADFTNAVLPGADFGEADLTGARLWRADLSGAMFMAAKLEDTILAESKLVGAKMRKANLTRSDGRSAIFRQADLMGTDLTDANLYGADVKGVMRRRQEPA